MWSRQESNLHLKFRKLLFYPLNYETFSFYHLLEASKSTFKHRCRHSRKILYRLCSSLPASFSHFSLHTDYAHLAKTYFVASESAPPSPVLAISAIKKHTRSISKTLYKQPNVARSVTEPFLGNVSFLFALQRSIQVYWLPLFPAPFPFLISLRKRFTLF